jgi:hypothetical protein
VNELWDAGLQDVRHAAKNMDSILPTQLQPGVRIYDFTKINISSETEAHHE